MQIMRLDLNNVVLLLFTKFREGIHYTYLIKVKKRVLTRLAVGTFHNLSYQLDMLLVVNTPTKNKKKKIKQVNLKEIGKSTRSAPTASSAFISEWIKSIHPKQNFRKF